jgi:hypothetical protein
MAVWGFAWSTVSDLRDFLCTLRRMTFLRFLGGKTPLGLSRSSLFSSPRVLGEARGTTAAVDTAGGDSSGSVDDG